MTRSMLKRALLGAAAALPLLMGGPVMAADHRDAPTIDDYSAIDINDVYMFRKPGDLNTLVVALSTQAVADPLFGSSYHFQENALYRLNFTTRADAKPTAHIDFVFSPFGNGPFCDPNPSPCQTFRAVFPNKVVIEGLATQGTSGGTPNAPIISPSSSSPIKVFAGPRQDPFFFDLVGFNRAVATGDPTKFTGVDAFLEKNINAIVVEMPVSTVFPSGSCVATTTPVFSTPCGVWAVTYLGHFNYDDPERFEPHPDGLRQVDRMGNPAVNTALIPGPLKDAFNFAEPKNDPKDFAGTIVNQIKSLDQKFCPNLPPACTTPNPFIPLLASVAVPDVLRFASNLPDGYPNGRRLTDRTTDILISLILQVVDGAANPAFTDGTQPKPTCPSFPFLNPPLQLSGTPPYQVQVQSCP